MTLLIRRMSATFGPLQNQTLELTEGLNILQAPNETGKSSWCAFLLAMLYGINSRERDRSGYIAEKNRYACWSGAPLSGRLECLTDLGELTLLRSTVRESAPMGELQALYTGTAQATDLNGLNCGERLLGVSREVFERSAFIRQKGLAIAQDPGLERRIAALITSGEEDVSYSEAADALKKQLNRRQHNRTGQIPALEAQLLDIRQQLDSSANANQRLTDLHQQMEDLSAREKDLQAALAQWQTWEDSQTQQALSQQRRTAKEARAYADSLRAALEKERIPTLDTIGRLRGAIVNLQTLRRSMEKARQDRDKAAEALLEAESGAGETGFLGMTLEQAQALPLRLPPKPTAPYWVLLPLALLGGLLGAFLYRHFSAPLPALAGGCVPVGLGGVGLFLSLRKKRLHWQTQADKLRRRRDIEVEVYQGIYQEVEAARKESESRSAAADALYNTYTSNEQAILLEVRRFAPAAYDIPTADLMLRRCAARRKDLAEAEAAARDAALRCQVSGQPATETDGSAVPPPQEDKAVIEGQLSDTRAQLAALRSAADHLTGQLSACGDPLVLRSTAQHLEQELAAARQEYQALQLALGALEEANTALQNRFAPALGKKTAQIFSRLTEGRYTAAALDRSFHLSAQMQGDHLLRDEGLLSAGTLDQLYLAARLAICQLVLPEGVPLILDDALVQFDDERCAAALRLLKEESRHRQILLFTCHSRESAFFAADREVSIQQLTNRPPQV